MFFVLSKILTYFFYPFTWIVLGFLIAWISKRPHVVKYSFRAAIVSLLFFSNTFIFVEFTRMWEPDGKKIQDLEHYDCAVVLGGMAEYDNSLGRLSIRRGGDRIWQAINLYHLGKVDRILISGNNGFLKEDALDEAAQFKKVLVENGIPEEDVLVENFSKNTYQNAIESKKIIDQHSEISSVLLITSALHMPRAEACFEKAGFDNMETFTTDHFTGETRAYTIDQFLIPNVSNLSDWQSLIHEWVGYISYKITGYI